MISRDHSPIEAPTDEIWKAIPDCPSIEVSNYGRARCYLKLDRSGTCRYARLGVRGKRQCIHVWVAQLFIGPRPEGMVINHIDNVPTNNHINNLEYVTPQENLRLGPHTKLDADLVRAIRKDFEAGGVTKVDLAKKYGVGSHQIGVVVLRQQWGDVL